MKKFIEYSKMSKKAQKEYNAAKRGSWNGLKPFTRTVKDKKHRTKADRCREKAALRTY